MRLNNLQALRGVACLLVVACHLPWWHGGYGGPDLPAVAVPVRLIGAAGVDLFFVLSGFVITWVNEPALGRPGRMLGYLGRRLWRVYPAYWLCWAGAAALLWWQVPPEVRQILPPHFGPSNVARRLLLLPSYQIHPVLPQAWSLSFEVAFYLAFAVFFVLPRRAFLPLIAAWAGAVIFVPHPVSPASLLLDSRVLEFLLGCAAAFALRRVDRLPGRSLLAIGAAGFVGGGLVEAFQFSQAPLDHLIRPLALGVPSVLLVFGAVAAERARRVSLPRWLQIVGDASYSIYLVHLPVFTCDRTIFRDWGSHLGMDLLHIAAVAVAGLGGGFLVHFAAERPLMNLARRRAKPSAQVIPLTPALRRAA
jgi:exopolysaccharide production protein ExoZ